MKLSFPSRRSLGRRQPASIVGLDTEPQETTQESCGRTEAILQGLATWGLSRRWTSVVPATAALVAGALPAGADNEFRKDIAPLLVRSCVACHGERTALGGWRSHTIRALFNAGKSGKIPIVPGKPEQSEIYRRVTSHDPVRRMPSGDDPLPPKAIAALRRWIQAGAKTDGVEATVPLASLEGPRAHPDAPAAYRNPLPVAALAVSPDATRVASAGYHEVLIWEAGTGKLIQRIGRLPQRIQALQWKPDGKSLLVGGGTPGEYGEVVVVEVDNPKRRVIGVFPDLVLAAGFSPDGTKVVAGGADFSARCYDSATAALLWSHKVHADWVTGIGFTGDGRYVASSGRDKVVKVYEVNTGTLFTTYNGHNRNIGRYRGQAPVWAVAFPSGSPQILSAGGGTWIQAWEPEKAKLETGDAGDMEERFQTGSHAKHFPHGLQGAVLAVAWAAGTVYAAGEDGVAVAIDAAAGQVRTRFGTPGEWAHAISVDPEGRILAVGRYDGTIALYDAASGVERSRFRATPAVSAVPSKKTSGVARPSVPTRRPIGGSANRSAPRTPLPRQ